MIISKAVEKQSVKKFAFCVCATGVSCLLLFWFFLTVQAQAAEDHAVKWVGALKNVHHGIDYSGRIDLTTLANLRHLYAVGPEEGLKGEITIWDSAPLLAEIVGGRLVINQTFDRRACFLVYGQVSSWQETLCKNAISDQNISSQVQTLARIKDLTLDKPFAFLVSGEAKFVRFHVLNKVDDLPPDGTVHQHERAKVVFTILKQPVEILGFYSRHHQGIFTHTRSSVHLHVKTPDGSQAGHVEAFELEPGCTIYLPDDDTQDR